MKYHSRWSLERDTASPPRRSPVVQTQDGRKRLQPRRRQVRQRCRRVWRPVSPGAREVALRAPRRRRFCKVTSILGALPGAARCPERFFVSFFVAPNRGIRPEGALRGGHAVGRCSAARPRGPHDERPGCRERTPKAGSEGKPERSTRAPRTSGRWSRARRRRCPRQTPRCAWRETPPRGNSRSRTFFWPRRRQLRDQISGRLEARHHQAGDRAGPARHQGEPRTSSSRSRGFFDDASALRPDMEQSRRQLCGRSPPGMPQGVRSRRGASREACAYDL